MESILTNPFILMFGTIFIGKFLGLIDIKGVSLGSSGGLFCGDFHQLRSNGIFVDGKSGL